MKLFAPNALLPTGWMRDVTIDIDRDGMIVAVDSGTTANGAETLRGPLVPGMANVHSHAFQRALAGLTEKGGPEGDNFWSWRTQMYRFLERIGPDEEEAIALELYIEMLKAGYTSVGEFHYLHRDPTGVAYANPAEMAKRIIAAATNAGMGLTLLPVFYAHADFGGRPPAVGQRRFILSIDDFLTLVETLQREIAATRNVCIGVAPHSLRAVAPDELDAIVRFAHAELARAPIHIHAAEQEKEVAACLAWSGARPVAWLLDHAGVDERWCLIHATHLNSNEISRLAKSEAVAGVCPTTEADLGDGIFAARDFLAAGGRFGVGGDSHVAVDPFAELRWLEGSQRLNFKQRNILVSEGESTGTRLYARAAAGGAQALAQPAGEIAVDHRADLVVLNADDPALAVPADFALDAAIFGPCRAPVRDVMVGGTWHVQEGRHAMQDEALAGFRAVMRRLTS